MYEYKCRECGATTLTRTRATSIPCMTCPSIMTRRFGFSFRRSMPEHFNHTTGQFVSNERKFKTQLKIMSEQATIRTGIEHDFQPVETLQTKASHGVTTDGLDDQARHRHDHTIPNEVLLQ